jgi:PilZ domain
MAADVPGWPPVSLSAISLKPHDNFSATKIVVDPTDQLMGDQRAIRVPIDLPARLEIETRSIRCQISNLSLAGVFVTGTTLTVDTRASIRFTPPTYPELRADCTVRWSCADGVGLRFERLTPADHDLLARVIRSVLTRMV